MTAYYLEWLTLDGNDPSVILQRLEGTLLGKIHDRNRNFLLSCNAPNVMFLEGIF